MIGWGMNNKMTRVVTKKIPCKASLLVNFIWNDMGKYKAQNRTPVFISRIIMEMVFAENIRNGW